MNMCLSARYDDPVRGQFLSPDTLVPYAGLVLDDSRRRRSSVVGGLSSVYDPALGQFLSPDTLVPDAGLVLDYGRFMYVRGNPVKYTDPTGHFSVEQLNFMGLYESDISAEIWKLLLFLEPNDYLGSATGSGQVQILFSQSVGEEPTLGLYVAGQDGRPENAVSWMAGRTQDVTVERFFVNTPGLQTVWAQGSPTEFWDRNVNSVTGSVREYSNSAAWLRYLDSVRDNLVFTLFKEASVQLGARKSMEEPGPGRMPRDITFSFEYSLKTDLLNRQMARDYHYRPGSADSFIGFDSYVPMAPVGPFSRLPSPTLR